MAKSKITSSNETETKTKQSAPTFELDASNPLAERCLAQYISMLEDAGKKEMAKMVRKAHAEFQEFNAKAD